jgi:hypothetical protein
MWSVWNSQKILALRGAVLRVTTQLDSLIVALLILLVHVKRHIGILVKLVIVYICGTGKKGKLTTVKRRG